MGFLDFFRANDPGLEPTLEERLEEALESASSTIEELREASQWDTAARRTLERSLEDLTWQLLDRVNVEERPETLRRIRERALKYFQRDPIVGSAVQLMTWYTFGRGVQKPGIPEDHSAQTQERGSKAREAGLTEATDKISDAEREKAESVIESFWMAPENKATITSPQSQQQKSDELQIDGEVFLVMFDGPGANGGPDDEASLLLSDISPDEIGEVVTQRDNQKMPLWYIRKYRTRDWDPVSRSYKLSDVKTLYYPHWRNEPGEGDLRPPQDQIADGRIMHVKVNSLSRQLRGRSELERILEWSKGFREFMDGRLAVARAVNKVAQRVRVEGGPTEIAKVMNQLNSADMLNMTRTPLGHPDAGGALPIASTVFHSPSVQFEPAQFETGAGVANADRQAFLSMIAAGTGWPLHYLGGEVTASLASAVSQELPVTKMVESRQELWKSVISDLTNEALRRAGIEDVTCEVIMPPILQRDLPQIASACQALVQSVDPTTQNVELKRWVLTQVAGAMNEPEVQETVAEIFPEGYTAPAPAQSPPQSGEQLSLLDQQAKRAVPGAPYRVQTADSARQNAERPDRGQARPG